MVGFEIENPHVMPYAGQDVRTLLQAQAQLRPDHPFIIWEPVNGPGLSWTYGEFARDTAKFAAGLHARGVRPGDRVLVHLDNCPASVMAWFACGWMGAVPVTTNARSTADELAYFVEHSGAVGAITQPKFAEMVGAAGPSIKWIAITPTDNGDDPGRNRPEPSQSLLRLLEGEASDLPHRAADPMAPFAIQYTSGTTSRPKAVLWTHANALWGGQTSARHEDLRPDDVHLISLPLFHTNALSYSILASAWVGATCVIQPRFSASRFWDVSVKHKCTWASMMPFCTRALMAHPVPKHNYRLWGSAVSSPPTDQHFGVKTIGWWGMTETVSHGTVANVHVPNLPMSVGRVAPGYELRLVNDEGKPASPGETADLYVRGIRGLSLFAEYVDNPEATAAAFDDEGFFITGDRLTIAEDGSLLFSERAKDMLKVGGENVAASEIERVVLAVPGVQEVAVVPKPHPMLDEVPVVFILASPDSPPDLAERTIETCRAQLAKFKVPQEVRFVTSFPRSTLEKIAKVQLRDILRAEAEAEDAEKA